MRWRNHCAELLDQRALPHRVAYVPCHSATDMAFHIRDLTVRGAPAIGCAAAYGVAVEALRLSEKLGHDSPQFSRALEEGFAVLAASRPTAVNLFWALDRMRTCWQLSQSPQKVAQRLLEEAHAILVEDQATNQTLGDYGADLLSDNSCVLTHCNAGALATAGYGTALGVIRSAVRQGKRISVIADETRPCMQGARLTAWELMQDNIPVTLITDNMAGYVMNSQAVDAVVVGADRVAANGDVVNKIGTYMVAVLARRHKIPFYVACPTTTIDLQRPNANEITIENRKAEEVLGFGELRWAAEGVETVNPAFDMTPADLVSALITERGVFRPPYPAAFQRYLQPGNEHG